MNTKREVLRASLPQWLGAKPYSLERRELTAQLAQTLQMHPRSIGRAMKREQLQSKGRANTAGRPKKYTAAVDTALRLLFDNMGHPCAENMQPMIEEYICWLKHEKRWPYSPEIEELVKSISLGSLKGRVRLFREKDGTLKGRSATVPSTLHVLVPVRKSHTWVGLPPGHLQLDTVVNCGDRLTGDVVYTTGGVDFATYWAEYTAQWNKGELATVKSAEEIQGRFPFAWLEVHPDTGKEFLNYHFYRWSEQAGIAMTRSEPYKKNDNMCIEERNGFIPRKYVGYQRIDDQALVPLVSEILKTACLLHNHFRPVRRMTKKVRVGSKWKRTYEKVSKTPYQRVLEHPEVDSETKERLRQEHELLNPLELKRKLDTLQKQLRTKLLKK